VVVIDPEDFSRASFAYATALGLASPNSTHRDDRHSFHCEVHRTAPRLVQQTPMSESQSDGTISITVEFR